MASYEKNLHKFDEPEYKQAILWRDKLKFPEEDVSRFAPGTLESDDPEGHYEENYTESEGDENNEDHDRWEHNDSLIPY